MLCEVLLSSLWFLFVIFWVETISVWLFLSMFYQDRAFYHWGDGVFADDPGQMIYMLSRYIMEKVVKWGKKEKGKQPKEKGKQPLKPKIKTFSGLN